MPKGRGANKYKKGKKLNPRGASARPKGILGRTEVTAQEMRRREQAAEAGGATRAERQKTRQREQEAARLAARKLTKASRKSE